MTTLRGDRSASGTPAELVIRGSRSNSLPEGQAQLLASICVGLSEYNESVTESIWHSPDVAPFDLDTYALTQNYIKHNLLVCGFGPFADQNTRDIVMGLALEGSPDHQTDDFLHLRAKIIYKGNHPLFDYGLLLKFFRQAPLPRIRAVFNHLESRGFSLFETLNLSSALDADSDADRSLVALLTFHGWDTFESIVNVDNWSS
jgi:hypothetical protein